MRTTARRPRITLCAALLVVACLPATAEERPFQLFVGLTPEAGYSEIDGFDYRHGFSLGLEYFVAPRWAAELRGTLDGYVRTGSGEDLQAFSIDLATNYYFYRGRRWGLFSTAGLRYADSDFDTRGSAGGGATGLLVGLGTELSLSRRFSFRLDATAVPLELGGDDERFDNLRLGVGFGYRF